MDVQALRGLAVSAVTLLTLAAPAAAHAGYAAHVRATPGLEWYLPLDEPSGPGVADVVTGAAFGEAGSRVAFGEPGALGTPDDHAVRFLGGGHDATSQSHIALGNRPTEDGTRAYAFEAWVKVETTDTRSLRIYSDEDYMGGMLLAARDGRIVLSRYDSGLRATPGAASLIAGIRPTAPRHATTVSTPVAAGAWTHVVATYDGASLVLYTDGVQQAAAVSEFPVDHDPTIFGGQGELGVRSALRFDGRHWLEFRGSLDEPALYRRALDACEVADHYRAAVTPPPSSSGQVTVCASVPPQGD